MPGGATGARDSKESGEALNSLGDRKRNAVYSALAVWAEEENSWYVEKCSDFFAFIDEIHFLQKFKVAGLVDLFSTH